MNGREAFGLSFASYAAPKHLPCCSDSGLQECDDDDEAREDYALQSHVE